MISRKLSAKFVCLCCRSGFLAQAEPFRVQPLLGASGHRAYSLEAIARSSLQEESRKSPRKERKRRKDDGQNDGLPRDRELGSRQPSDEDASSEVRNQDVSSEVRNQDVSQLVRRTKISPARERDRSSGSRYADDRSDALAELTPPPPKRMYMAYGCRLHVDQSKLSINMLGKPTETIVLHERGKWKIRPEDGTQEHENDEGEENEANPVATQSILAKETRHTSAGDAIRNINELRPKETVLSRDQYKKLADTLQQGFMNDQLREYTDQFFSKETGTKSSEKQPFFVLNKPAWTPLVEEGKEKSMARSSGNSPEHDHIPWYGVGYMENFRSPKELLVVTIIRRCWGISRQDLNEGPGRIDVKLAEVHFSMLLLGTQRWVAEKTRHFLQPGEHVELSQSEHVLSVFAPRSTAEVVVKEIVKVLKNTTTSKIPTTRIFARVPEDLHMFKKDLREVGQVTNTLARMDKEGNNILVSWVDIRKYAGQWERESSGDVVFRLLLQRYQGPKHSWAQLIDSHPATLKPLIWPESSREAGQYAPIPVNKDSLSWLERSKTWARFVLPLSGQATDLHLPPLLKNQLLLPVQVGGPGAAEGVHQDSVVKKRDWSAQSFVLTKAVFGHLILDTSDLSRAKLRKQVYRPHLESTFLPIIPPLPSLDRPLVDPPPCHLGHTTILLRFQPDASQPNLPSIPGCLLPSLELRLLARRTQRAQDAEILRVLSLRALTALSQRPICLTQGPVDLLLEQTSYFELDGAGIDEPAHPAAPVHHFLRRSDLRYVDGKMYVPARLPRMPLPRRLLAKSEETDDLVEVDYRFAGLETQDAVVADWKGFSLVHTSVNASPYGPRRAELSLEAQPLGTWSNTVARPQPEKSDSVTLAGSAAKDAFLKAVKKILLGSNKFKWMGQQP